MTRKKPNNPPPPVRFILSGGLYFEEKRAQIDNEHGIK